MSRLALYLLGPPRIERDGKSVRIHRRKAIALIAYLAVAGPSPVGRSHSRDALATLFWPEHDQSRARAGLRGALAALKKALDDSWLDVDQEAVRLHRDAEFWLDVDEFQDRLAECRTHGHPEDEVCPACLPLLTEAAVLYRDDFLAGFTLRDSPGFDEWQFFESEGLRDELASALERLVHHHSSQGEYELAIGYARRWLGMDTLHEPAHRHLMELYAQAGRHTAALRQYRACVRILEEELGFDPSEETTALYERIRAERARPREREVMPPSPTPPPPSSPWLPPFLTEEGERAEAEGRVFVARERELARLEGYLEAALAGQGRVVFITGGPGRGKSALMSEFARQAMEAHPDLLVASGNCNAYSGIGDPYLPFREVIGMLTGDAESRWAAGAITREHAQRLWAGMPLALQAVVDSGPSLVNTVLPGGALLSRATVAAPEGPVWLGQLRGLVEREKPRHSDLEQRALFEQFTNVVRALAEAHPLVLMLDDVQWADTASISLLFHLERRLEGSRILIACAYRPEEVALEREGERHPLESVLSEFKRRFGDVWVDLGQVDETEGRRFVDTFLDSAPNRLGEDFRRGLFHHTGGYPLFTIEVLRDMQERGDLVQDERGRWVEGPALEWSALPARVEGVIEARIGRLGEELRETLTVASVEGEAFTAEVVARVQGVDERGLVRRLSGELEKQHRLVGSQGVRRLGRQRLSLYRFQHHLFQKYLYNSLDEVERSYLHEDVGNVLEELYGDQTEEIVVQLARHFGEAGIAEKAMGYLLKAGNRAQRLYANEEALSYFQRALEWLDGSPLGESRKDWRLEALTGLGQIHFGIGKIAEAEGYFRQAIALGQEIGLSARELVRLCFWLGDVLFWQSRYDEMICLGEKGLTLLGDDTKSLEAVLMNQIIAGGHSGKGNQERHREFSYRAAQFIQSLPYSEELRPAYGYIASAFYLDKNVKEAMRWLQTLERRAKQHYDFRALGEAHFLAGLILFLRGDYQEAIVQSQRGLELCTRIGDAKRRCWLLRNMGRQFLALGDLQKAEECAYRMLGTAESVGRKFDIADAFFYIGTVSQCQGALEQAVGAFRKASHLYPEIDLPFRAQALVSLGRAYLAQGKRQEAVKQFQEAVALTVADTYPFLEWRPPLARALSGLEEAYEDPKVFRAFCHRFREEPPEFRDSPFVQWYLEPTEALDFPQNLIHDSFAGPLSSDWVWQDPLGDCSFTVQNGLEIHAANGRDLWYINLSAPRLLRSVSGDFAVQAVCVPASGDNPAIGGLLLWKDKENYLRLDRGVRGEHEISFEGCLENKDVIIGRGRLPAERVFLRLERIGHHVNALCSADGVDWFTVGHVEFPVEDPVEVGLHAIGNIDRTIYHGAYPEGTAIVFESFQLWGM